jgi:rod shape-determining protein MreD
MAPKTTKSELTEIIFLFFLTLFFTFFLNKNFYFLKLTYFAPFLILIFYKTSIYTSIWLSIISGLILDLFSSSYFGLNAICYASASVFLYNEKKYFSLKNINISIFTAIYSFIFSLFYPLCLFIFEKGIKITFKWMITDLLIMPFIDGIYAFLLFAIPLIFIQKTKNINLRNLWKRLRKKNFRRSQRLQ